MGLTQDKHVAQLLPQGAPGVSNTPLLIYLLGARLLQEVSGAGVATERHQTAQEVLVLDDLLQEGGRLIADLLEGLALDQVLEALEEFVGVQDPAESCFP